MQHQFKMNTPCNEGRAITFASCSNVNNSSVCVQTKVHFASSSFFSRKQTFPTDLQYSCQPSLTGESGLLCTTELSQDLCDVESIPTTCSQEGIVPKLVSTASYSALAAAIPEAVGDALRLIGNVSETSANYATQATNLLFIALTGSWFSAGMGMMTQTVGELAGLSKPNARMLGNTVSYGINIAQNPDSTTLITMGTSLAVGKLSLWAEKKIAKQVENYINKPR
jgi:hypothetical protein